MARCAPLAGFLLASTILTATPAWAQVSGGTPAPASDPTPDTTSLQDADEPTEISVPGADIVVTGRRGVDIAREASQVVSVLSSADIARTGEGNIAGSLQRVTGLSVAGNGFVYVRGLGDRYSLALLNGSPLPSPEPLRRVVPLDIFPTSVIASSLVQKSYSANFPGEFGGGVINLTTKAAPDEPFLTIGASISGDTETTGQLGYTYFGSPTDFTGFDDGTRAIPAPLAAAFASGKPILEGADFSRAQLSTIATSLVNARTTVLQRSQIPANFAVDVSGGGSWDVGGVRLGLIAAAGINNRWRTRQTLQQLSLDADLSGPPQTSFNRVITDDRAVVNGLLGLGLEFGRNRVRWTNLYVRDSLKQSRLAVGTDLNQQGRDIMPQDTAWYERQLIDTQLVGEFRFDPLSIDLRAGYANSQREAPYERSFTYVRTNQAADPLGRRYVNDLGGNKGDASVAFSDLDENLYSAGADLTYALGDVKLSAGYAYTDTSRTSTRRAFQYRAANLPLTVQQLRPDYLLSDFTIQTYGITLLETSAQDGTAAFDASLKVHAGYGQVVAQILPALSVTAGVRFERGMQRVAAIDLFGTGLGDQFNARLNRDYFLPAVTIIADIAPEMQVRLNGSRTIARPQFRELIRQVYIDPESNRTFQGNPSLVDTRLWNAEARYEWYFARDQRLTLSGFYKKLDKPIEAFSSILSSDVTTSYANAPEADLYGVEVEAQKYVPLNGLFDGDFFASRRAVLIGNYTYTQSKIMVGDGDATVINGVVQPSSNFFRDGAPLTGQSDHLVNFQLGLEDADRLSQQTLLLSYASKRVTTRGPSGQPDVKEQPGLRLDFVAREGVTLFGVEAEIKFEARNLTGQNYREYQQAGDNRIFYNRYDVGTSFSLGAGLKF